MVVSSILKFENSEAFANSLDEADPLKHYRDKFCFPSKSSLEDGKHNPNADDKVIYFAGNSLGLQPKTAKEYINRELEDWAAYGVEGHWQARSPWLPYHEQLTEMAARLVGAKPIEVVIMNTLTVNLHLMLVSFYQPTKSKYKILIEGGAFPSDQYAVQSQTNFHGYSHKDAVLELHPREGEETMRTEDIISYIEEHGDEIAVIVLGTVNYLTGQAFEVPKIVEAAHKKGCKIGLNLAHGAGNLVLKLHEWKVDFAVWCNYKYLNGGPGTIAGCFVHEEHAKDYDLARFAGWWGHNKKIRFEMGPDFDPIPGAEGWQLSNPPIFQMAALKASYEIFDEVTMPKLREKGDKLTGFLEFLLNEIPGAFCKVITPKDVSQRGSQLSIRFQGNPKELLNKLREHGAICDFREPDIIRAAPAPLYCSFKDVYDFAKILESFAAEKF